eukprot:TRINITY_DN15480_c0_g2_i1.p1 TRINITY_DN15480_c0_g2~~TRINITY_DN15480_c0_g2_i1.p1  ORF type:complete len:212 (-),score=28.44 TRINITY_DN15480_c0_g2_i1:677-1273(-)
MFGASCCVVSIARVPKEGADLRDCVHLKARDFACPSSALSEEQGALVARQNADPLPSSDETDIVVAAQLLIEVEESVLKLFEHARVGRKLDDNPHDRVGFRSRDHTHDHVEGGRRDQLQPREADDVDCHAHSDAARAESQMHMKETHDADDVEFVLGDKHSWVEARMCVKEICEGIGISCFAQIEAKCDGLQLGEPKD